MADLEAPETKASGLTQEFRELRADYVADVQDLNAKLLRLEERLNQEESDRERADTRLEDEIGRVERSQ